MTTPAHTTSEKDDTLSTLFSLLSTKDDVIKLTSSLDSLKEKLFKTGNKSIQEHIDECIPQSFAEVVSSFLTANTDGPSPVEIGNNITALKASCEKMKSVSVTVAIDPPKNTISRLSEWIKKTYGTDTLMEFTIDPGIIGGAVIIYGGTYLDLSLRKKLNAVFEAKKDEIEKTLSTQQGGQQS